MTIRTFSPEEFALALHGKETTVEIIKSKKHFNYFLRYLGQEGLNAQPKGQIGQVAKLWRYPVSSLAGESLSAMRVSADGAKGDRLFGIVEKATGAIARPDQSRR